MNSRIIFGVIAIIYLIIATLMQGPEGILRCLAFLIVPLACIWYGEEMGSYTGFGLGLPAITKSTPGCFVAFGGWLLLALPLVIGLIVLLTDKS